MVGREIDLTKARASSAREDLVLSVADLSRQGVFEGVTFDLHRGEVLGFAGLIGAGRTDVGLALFGIEPATSGTILLGGKPVTVRSPRDGMNLGIAYVSEDRRQLGLVLPMAIFANITLPVLRRYLNRLGLVRTRLERQTADGFRARLVDPHAVGRSRGRQAVGRQSAEGHAEQMAQHQPLGPDSRRTDARRRRRLQGRGARDHRRSSRQRASASSSISSDLPEVLVLSDRVLVMREGRQMAILDRAEANEETVMTAAMGQRSAEPVDGRPS